MLHKREICPFLHSFGLGLHAIMQGLVSAFKFGYISFNFVSCFLHRFRGKNVTDIGQLTIQIDCVPHSLKLFERLEQQWRRRLPWEPYSAVCQVGVIVNVFKDFKSKFDLILYGFLMALGNSSAWSYSATTAFVEGLVSFDSVCFAFWIDPAALPHTVRLVKSLQYQFTWSRYESNPRSTSTVFPNPEILTIRIR